MENDDIELIEGNTVTISMEEVLGTQEKFSVTYEGLIDDVQVGGKILLDDGQGRAVKAFTCCTSPGS